MAKLKAGLSRPKQTIQLNPLEIREMIINGIGLDLGLAFGIEKIVSKDIILCFDCELQTNIASSISAKDAYDTPQLSIRYGKAGNDFAILPRFFIRKVL